MYTSLGWALMSVIIGFSLSIAQPNPLHASCDIDWIFGLSCQESLRKFEQQIEEWKGSDCGKGSKCGYKLISLDKTILKATHTAPTTHYVNDLTIVFTTDGNRCLVNGKSSSESWYAVLDYGTNYCTLHNLVTGSGLSKTSQYKETTDNARCPQYSPDYCNKY